MENSTDEAVAKAIYAQILEREPEAEGLQYRQTQLKTGAPVIDVVEDVARSDEFINRYLANQSAENAVANCYRRFLARDMWGPDAGGAAWLELARQQNWFALVHGFVRSDEYLAKFGYYRVPGAPVAFQHALLVDPLYLHNGNHYFGDTDIYGPVQVRHVLKPPTQEWTLRGFWVREDSKAGRAEYRATAEGSDVKILLQTERMMPFKDNSWIGITVFRGFGGGPAAP